MGHLDPALLLTILAALVYTFMNGYVASSALVAMVIASGALGPRQALILASLSEFAGPLIFGVAVANTISKGLVNTAQLPLSAVLAMLLGAVVWLVITYRLGLPVSPSHALIGGIVGATLVAEGWSGMYPVGLLKVVLSLLLAPIIGLICGWFFMELMLVLARGASPRINGSFKQGQIGTTVLLAVSQSSNDAQKAIGVIMMALAIAGLAPDFAVPTWVMLMSAVVIALGVAAGGSRTIRTLAVGFFRVRPVHGFTTQAVSSAIVMVAALIGAPVSTGQVVSSSLVGVGSAERMSKVRWNVATNLAVAWLLTIPASAFMSAAIYLLVSQVMS